VNQPQPMPPQELLRIFQMLVAYLLYEKKEESELRTAFLGLVVERHRHFHSEETNWETCGNQVCANARQILEHARKPEVYLSPLSTQLINGYSVCFNPTPQWLHAWLVTREESDELKKKKASETPAAPQLPKPQIPQTKLIIGG